MDISITVQKCSLYTY